ncbi:DDE-type integrase/transposase/recombinase, partial [Mariniluteicoccus endophyticus]
LDLTDDQAALLCGMSPATIDRRLADDRAQLLAGKGRSMTKPGSLLKSSIPMKTWSEWSDTTPGFVEIDLVSHDGGDNNGEHCWTLCVTDIATGWTAAVTVMGKGQRRVCAALEQIWLAWPFHVAGIHSDNGSEFINHHLIGWCQTRQITFSRSRPTRSNDNAWVEQKNWSLIRRCAGYFRYDTPRELSLLNQLWAAEALLVNLFTPQQKLATKTRQGAKVTKTYHPPTGLARTPHHPRPPRPGPPARHPQPRRTPTHRRRPPRQPDRTRTTPRPRPTTPQPPRRLLLQTQDQRPLHAGVLR